MRAALGAALAVSAFGMPFAQPIGAASPTPPPIVFPTPPSLPAYLDPDTTGLSRPGPHSVGLTTVPIAGSVAEVWYPAAAGSGYVPSSGTTSPNASASGSTAAMYDLKDWLPSAVKTSLGKRSIAPINALGIRNAPGLDGRHPVIVFSHGFGGYRLQSSFLMSHLASWGFVVAAPDHPSRTLGTVLSGKIRFGQTKDVDDLKGTLTALTNADRSTGPLKGLLDLDNVGAIGHSAGANAVINWSAKEPRLQVVVALAGGASSILGTPKGGLVPILYIAGENDQIIRVRSIQQAFDTQNAPRRIIRLKRSGHLAFSDICTINRGKGGLVGTAESLKIPVLPMLRTLAQDGCNPPNAPVEEAWPVIRLATLAQLRTVFGAGSPGFGLDQGTFDTLASKGAVSATFQIG